MSNLEIINNTYLDAVSELKEEWFLSYSTKWYDYIIFLPPNLQITYLLVVFDNQISNGGFDQYFVNGYGQFSKETINALIEIGAIKKSGLLAEAYTLVNSNNLSDEMFRQQLLQNKIESLFDNDKLFELLNKLDSEYYGNNEDIKELLEYYLLTH